MKKEHNKHPRGLPRWRAPWLGAALLGLVIVSCGKPGIAGRWEVESSNAEAGPGALGELAQDMQDAKFYIFNSDGTGSVRFGLASESFKWKIEGQDLTRTSTSPNAFLDPGVVTTRFRLEGDKLVLTSGNEEIILRRK